MRAQSVFERQGEVFRISDPGDEVVNEYRMTLRGLEFRVVGSSYADWRVVCKADLEMHVVLETPVAKWMERRKSKLLD